MTYAGIIEIASEVLGKKIRYITVPQIAFTLGGLINPALKEANELMPRYRQDNIFDSSKFAARFPDFDVTTYREGITQILTN